MAATAERAGFLERLLAERPGDAAGRPAWLKRLRSDALERANALPLPSVRDEDWRFTDLAPLARLACQPVEVAPEIAPSVIAPFVLPQASARLVFVDGVFAPALSEVQAIAQGHVADLAGGLARHADLVEAHLGRHAPSGASAFSALNTAFLGDAAVVVLGRDEDLPGAVHILHVATRRESAQAIHPRTLVVAGQGSRASVVEDFVAPDGGGYFSAPVAEFVLAEDAEVSHLRLQCESDAAFHIAACAVRQARGSRFRSLSAALGARLSRLDLGVLHAAPGCETEIDGLALIGGRQLADTHSFVDHAFGEGRLRQMHKAIVSGAAHAVFNGKVLVREGAQRTDARQASRSLLLSGRARVDTKPQLEIFADDVKCAHGATVGQLDPEELFYLRSRGLSEPAARGLLTGAFAGEVTIRIPHAQVRARVEAYLAQRTREAA